MSNRPTRYAVSALFIYIFRVINWQEYKQYLLPISDFHAQGQEFLLPWMDGPCSRVGAFLNNAREFALCFKKSSLHICIQKEKCYIANFISMLICLSFPINPFVSPFYFLTLSFSYLICAMFPQNAFQDKI